LSLNVEGEERYILILYIFSLKKVDLSVDGFVFGKFSEDGFVLYGFVKSFYLFFGFQID
jgi:hypothetical protein